MLLSALGDLRDVLHEPETLAFHGDDEFTATHITQHLACRGYLLVQVIAIHDSARPDLPHQALPRQQLVRMRGEAPQRIEYPRGNRDLGAIRRPQAPASAIQPEAREYQHRGG
ncbi:MAG: hypothetical protein WDO12_03095 [Pseudomonadota bacterium]